MFKTLNAKDLKEPWTRWFLYGKSGSGKTRAAATFPKPLFLIPIVENSIATLSGLNVPYLIVRDWSSPFNESEGVGGMNAILQRLEAEYKRDKHGFPYHTIVADGMTHFAELIKDELTQGSKIGMDVQKYDKVTSYFRNIHARLSNLGEMHVVYCALAQVDEKTDVGDPYLSKKVKEVIPSSCEVKAYLSVKDMGNDKNGKPRPKQHKLYTTPHGQWDARTRYTRLPPVIENFNFNDIRHLLVNTAEDEAASLETESQVAGQPS